MNQAKTYREIQHLFGEGKTVPYLAQRFNLKEKEIERIIQLPPCIICQDYHDCTFGAGKEWYSYADMRWCPFQCIWIIQYRHTLLDGNLPHSDASTYIDPQIFTGFRDEAYFTKPEEILAELEARLKTTKRAGETLIEEIDRGLTAIELLSSLARDALMYIKGTRRKRQSFSQWLADREYKSGKKEVVYGVHT